MVLIYFGKVSRCRASFLYTQFTLKRVSAAKTQEFAPALTMTSIIKIIFLELLAKLLQTLQPQYFYAMSYHHAVSMTSLIVSSSMKKDWSINTVYFYFLHYP